MCLCLLFRAARGECAREKTRAQPARVFVEPPFFLPPEMYKRKLEGKAYLSSPIKMGTVPAEKRRREEAISLTLVLGTKERRGGENMGCALFYFSLILSIIRCLVVLCVPLIKQKITVRFTNFFHCTTVLYSTQTCEVDVGPADL